MLKEGMTLAGRYEIQRQLGRGAVSRVYLACDMISGRMRALKEIDKCSDGRLYAFARREAEIVWELKYPYFPEIFDILEGEKADYIVMEYLHGETAGERLRRMGRQPMEEVVQWAKDLCLMLSYLHGQTPPMVYCDLKPDNMMLQPEGNLRLIDFGAVLQENDFHGGDRAELVVLGTRGYAPPEQFDGAGTFDTRADIYALGVTMYELLTGQDPVLADVGDFSYRQLRKEMPGKLARIIQRCTEKEVEKRYQTCEEIRVDLLKMGKT